MSAQTLTIVSGVVLLVVFGLVALSVRRRHRQESNRSDVGGSSPPNDLH